MLPRVPERTGRNQVLVAGGAADRDRKGELEILDVALVDRGERREALRAEIVVVHEPVLRLGIAQAVEGDVGGGCGAGGGEQGKGQCCEKDRRFW
jgi:hypothetical protein